MDRSGQSVQRLTNSPGLDHRPAWSPDGRRIAFTSNRDGNYEIYVISADGARIQRVTHHSERDDYAAWHPDGQHVAVVSERHGKCNLYLIEVAE
jgi:TolB protein